MIYADSSHGRLLHVALAMPDVIAFNEIGDPKSVMFKAVPFASRVRWEMREYAQLLKRLGVRVDLFEYAGKYPNQIFLRDLGIVIDDTFYLAAPKYKVRQGEEEVLLGWLYGLGVVKKVHRATEWFEGADVILDRRRLIVSTGNRTSAGAAIEMSIHCNRELVICEALPEGVPQHLLGHKQMLNGDTLLTRHRLSDERFGFQKRIALDEVPEVKQNFAANIVVVGYNTIIMPAGNPLTRARYEEYGLKVYETPTFEIQKMGGSLTCLTLPLERVPVYV